MKIKEYDFIGINEVCLIVTIDGIEYTGLLTKVEE